uniref:Uncharacterized protein n=1 Tax=Setaria italica TaxID=4555 RepID=K3XTP6_SETIT
MVSRICILSFFSSVHFLLREQIRHHLQKNHATANQSSS